MKKTILFIDDDPVVVVVGKLLIEDLGYNFKSAEDGKSGLEIINSDVDAILLDLMLPDIHGLEVLRQIKADQKYAKIPVIVQTGMNDKREISKAIKLGAEATLLKPYNKEDIQKILQKLWPKKR